MTTRHELQVEPDVAEATYPASLRRERKREIDRRSQRLAREKKKTRLAYLETIVSSLEQQKDDDGRVDVLLKQVTKLNSENTSLSQAIHDIQNVLSDHMHTQAGTSVSSSVSRCHDESMQNPIAPSPQIQSVIKPPTYSEQTPIYLDDAYIQFSDSVFEDATCALNQCMTSVEDSEENEIEFEDVLIRGMMEGWESVETTIQMTDTWKAFRYMDEKLWSTAAQIERLAVFYLTFTLIEYYRRSSSKIVAKLPPWYGQRFGYINTSHVESNFMPWPGLRQKWVQSPQRYKTKRFWLAYTQCFKIQWPYETRDTFLQRSDTGRYEISPIFVSYISDITRFAMRPDFFILFPDLRADIPTTSSIPKSMSNIIQMQMAGNDPALLQKRIEQWRMRSGGV